MHDLTVFSLICTINKTRGASLFAVDLQKQTSLSGEFQYTLRMCVAVGRRLQVFLKQRTWWYLISIPLAHWISYLSHFYNLQWYYWKNRDFHELHHDIGLIEVPRVISWCKDSLCVGFRREYHMVEVRISCHKSLWRRVLVKTLSNCDWLSAMVYPCNYRV